MTGIALPAQRHCYHHHSYERFHLEFAIWTSNWRMICLSWSQYNEPAIRTDPSKIGGIHKPTISATF